MPILDCHVAATSPAVIYVVVGTEGKPPGPPTLKKWKVVTASGDEFDLGDWIATTRGLAHGGGYVYKLHPGPDADPGWINSGDLVHVTTEFDKDRASCFIAESSEAWGNGVADAVNNQGQATLRRLNAATLVTQAGSDLTGLRGGVEDLIGFPLITSGSGVGGGAAAVATAPTTGGQALVDAELRRVLGRTPAPGDVKATLALMDRAMYVTEQDGVQRWVVGRSADIVQTENGIGVTGRQASLAGLARDTLATVRPLAERIEQLAPTDDNPALLDAARANYLSAATDAVAEAGVPGGPLALKANVLLSQALDQLGAFGQELGVLESNGPGRFTPTRVNVITTRDEEQFTMFLIVLERWLVFHDAFRAYLGDDHTAATEFDLTSLGPDFGTEFTLLDRKIDVIAEAVDELDAALMSVGIDRQEREAMLIDDGPAVADVMDWAQGFAEREARPLIQQAGIRGVELLPERLRALCGAVDELQNQIAQPGDDGRAERALRHPRVGVALDKLADELTGALDLAQRTAATVTGDRIETRRGTD